MSKGATKIVVPRNNPVDAYTMAAIVREATPFILAAILVLAIISFVPETVLWLPRVIGYKG